MDSEREFGEVKAKVDALADSFMDCRAELRVGLMGLRTDVAARLDNHSRRLGALERWRSYMAGGLAALMAMVMAGKWLLSFVWPGGR